MREILVHHFFTVIVIGLPVIAADKPEHPVQFQMFDMKIFQFLMVLLIESFSLEVVPYQFQHIEDLSDAPVTGS